ncbi:MAG: divergent polysaccharide deacetylase family protein, partial [Pseudomonadota bacterium]
HGTHVAARAAQQEREVLLHLPMQALQDATGVGTSLKNGLQVTTSERGLRRYLAHALQQVPGAIGINNHRGSRLTQHTGAMRVLMRALACQRNLYFIDSYTTAESVALAEAQRAAVPSTRRHVFLDNDPNRLAVDAQIDRLIQMAQERGFAVAIGHPKPATLAALRRLPERLNQSGISLVAPGELVSIPAVTADASAD